MPHFYDEKHDYQRTAGGVWRLGLFSVYRSQRAADCGPLPEQWSVLEATQSQQKEAAVKPHGSVQQTDTQTGGAAGPVRDTAGGIKWSILLSDWGHSVGWGRGRT